MNLGIDFTGGSLLEVRYLDERPDASVVREKFASLELGDINIQPVGEQGFIFRLKEVDEATHQKILIELSKVDKQVSTNKAAEKDTAEDNVIVVDEAGEATVDLGQLSSEKYDSNVLEQLRFESVGPSIGQELKLKSLYAIVIVLILIVAYIAWSFRKVSKPVASWKYGISAIVALFHDVLIVLGVFAVLCKVLGVEIDTAFVAAILTVLGYSVNDTIVVFDRIRENLPRSDENFASTVNTSLNQTIGRSINTSATTLLVLLSIFFFGGETIKYFVLALAIGAVAGTYSSIFLASPLLVVWEKLKK